MIKHLILNQSTRETREIKYIETSDRKYSNNLMKSVDHLDILYFVLD